MIRLAVVYFSETGITAKLADAFHAGATEVARTALCRIGGNDIVAGRFENDDMMKIVDEADGLAFGSPTLMGGPAAQFKAFADATSNRWSRQRWARKVATGFTTGSCANGDQSHTLTYFTILAAQHGMLWCGLDLTSNDQQGRNRLGSQIGLVTQSVNGTLPSPDLETARYLGRRLADVTQALASGVLRL